jgi:hypothetical protein
MNQEPKRPAWLPTWREVVREAIIILLGAMAISLLLGLFPSLKRFLASVIGA